MKALRFYGRKDLRLENIDEPVPADDEVKVKVSYAGICGTDYEEYLYGPLWICTSPHPITGHSLKESPMILGHEFSGIVSETGKNAGRFKKGDRVAAYSILYCGKCDNCKAGKYYLCENIGCFGLHRQGAFQEYVTVPQSSIFRIPDNVSEMEAAVGEPLGFSLNSVDLANIKVGDDVVVFGAGTIGLLYLQVAKVRGAKRVFMAARRKNRLDTALKLGADAVIDTENDNVTEAILDLTGGKGADVIMEATGSNKVLDQIFTVVKSGGTILLGGVFPENADIDLKQIVNSGRSIVGAVAHNPVHFETALQMISDGRVNVSEIISKSVSLDNAFEEGFVDYLENKGKYIKLVIQP